MFFSSHEASHLSSDSKDLICSNSLLAADLSQEIVGSSRGSHHWFPGDDPSKLLVGEPERCSA